MSNAYTNCLYHVVFSTKERFPFLSAEIRPRLFSFVGGIVRGVQGRPFIVNGVEDHLHLLALLPSQRSVADSVRDIKANSSRWLRKTHPEMKNFAWQRGYGAFSVSESQVERVRLYIANQESHHRNRTFQQEFLTLLRQNRIAFDPARVWQ
jgi:putative transposase